MSCCPHISYDEEGFEKETVGKFWDGLQAAVDKFLGRSILSSPATLVTIQLIAPTPLASMWPIDSNFHNLPIALAIALAPMPQLIVHGLMDVPHTSSCLGF